MGVSAYPMPARTHSAPPIQGPPTPEVYPPRSSTTRKYPACTTQKRQPSFVYPIVLVRNQHSHKPQFSPEMRIACLQFSPQLGKVEENIARANGLLSQASNSIPPIDILVLPELAFSGTYIPPLFFHNPIPHIPSQSLNLKLNPPNPVLSLC